MDQHLILVLAIPVNQYGVSAVSSRQKLYKKYNLSVLMLEDNLTSGLEASLFLHILS